MISIILPSLNVANYILQCITSVQQQSFSDIEIICVDAGSTDGTLEIIRDLSQKDKRIKCLISEKKSYGYQINQGIRAARGEYIGIVETDDYINKDMYRMLVNLTYGGKADFVKAGFVGVSDSGWKKKLHNYRLSGIEEYSGKLIHLKETPHMRSVDQNHIWAGIYRKKFLMDNDIWFNETNGAAYQDTAFSTIVNSIAQYCVYINKSLYFYRMDRSESSVKCKNKWNCVIEEYDYVDCYFSEHSVYPKDEYLYYKYMSASFLWNLFRLDEEERVCFYQAIADKVFRIKNNELIWNSFSEDIKSNYIALSDVTQIEKLVEQKEFRKRCINAIIEKAKINGGFVCVGAGYSFEKLLDIQDVESVNIALAVCDNSVDLIGMCKREYTILSIRDLIDKYKNKQWLITATKYGLEIRKQLLDLGVDNNNITSLEYVPTWTEYVCDYI